MLILDYGSPPSETVISIVEEKSVQKMRPLSVVGQQEVDDHEEEKESLLAGQEKRPHHHPTTSKGKTELLKMKYEDYRSTQEYDLAPQVESVEVGVDREIFVSKFRFVEVAPKAFFNIRTASGIDPVDFYVRRYPSLPPTYQWPMLSAKIETFVCVVVVDLSLTMRHDFFSMYLHHIGFP
jgi:hypothetical protein